MLSLSINRHRHRPARPFVLLSAGSGAVPDLRGTPFDAARLIERDS